MFGIIQLLITLLIFALDESANYGTPTIRRFVAQQMAREVEMVELGEKKAADYVVNVDVKPPNSNNDNDNDKEDKAKLQNEEATKVEAVQNVNDAEPKEAKRALEASSSIETTPPSL